VAKNITKAKHRFPLRQIRRIPKFLRRAWPILTLIILTLLIAFLNYEPGTFLLGWDNLSSELGPAINLKRALFSVWQEYQSLGLLGGMAHAADLPRVFLIYLFSFLPGLPLSSIRYLFIFLPLILGPLGVYLFLSQRLFKTHLDSRTVQYASFLGGLFYLLNLATLQTFFTPFESFTYFYGAFPWLLFFVTGYLETPSWRSLIAIFIVTFISSPAFYVETLFVVFCLSLIPIFSEVFFSPKKKINSLKKISQSILSVLIPSLFWLLPVVFFVFTNAHVGEQAKINLISSPETYFRNLQFGNLLDIALLKGYFFNFVDLFGLGKFDYLLSVWRSHLAVPVITYTGYLLFVFVLVGIYYSITKKFFWTKSLIGILLICLFFLLGGGLLINSGIPLVGELFRSPFTKFSTPLSFTFACFFAIGSVFLLDLFTYLHSRLTYPLTLFSVTFILVIFMSPVFSGNLISSNMRLSLPSEYTDLFNYLKTQDPSTRIANFPQYTFWGWNYYDWNYRGSGFLWYGIRQPILDRAFDVWEKNSEKYYKEVSTALYSDNQKKFEALVDKYSIGWILLDKHVISPNLKTDLGNATLEKFLTTSSKFSLAKNFNDKIFLYQVALDPKPQNFLSFTSPRRSLDEGGSPTHPFSSLTLRPNSDWTEKSDYLSTSVPLASPKPQATAGLLTIPSLTATENLLPVRLEYQKSFKYLTIRFTPLVPTLFLDQKQIDLHPESTFISLPLSSTTNSFILQVDRQFWPIQIPAELPNLENFTPLATTYLPTKSSFQVNLFDATADTLDLTNSLSQANPAQCYLQKPNRNIEKITSHQRISLLGTDVVGCLSTPLPFISTGSLISLSFTYSSPTLTPGNANISGQDYGALQIPQPLEPRSVPRRVQVFASSTGKYQQANLILEASDTKSVQEIVYQNISLSTHQQLYSAKSQIKDIPDQEIKLTGKEKNLQISLPITDTTFDIRQTPDSNGLFPEPRNCDQFNSGNTVKLVSQNGFLYQSKNAIECDYLNLRHLPHSLNYLLSFQTEFQRGLPLTVCLENQSTYRCDVFERLAKTNATQSLIQPISNSQEPPGYTLHLFNQSIGNRITSNVLKNLSLRPIPLNFMKSISISSLRGSEADAAIQKNNQSISSTHPAEFLYTVSLNPSLRGSEADAAIQGSPSTLNLYQTQSPYWQAIEVTEADLRLPPWLLTAKIFFTYPYLNKLPHADAALWHNSWDLPASSLRGADATWLSWMPLAGKSHSIVLIFLPQYLEFIGLAFLTTPLFIFILQKLLATKKTPSLRGHKQN